MNRNIFILSALFSVALVFSSFSMQKPAIGKDETINGIRWNETTHNFGDVKLGPDAVFNFEFKNKGKKAIKVAKVEPGCSCTISSFTSKLVKKNRTGTITVTYKTKDNPAFFKKFIQVTFEDGRTQELIITGNVIF